jgi:DNA invertase Pin-like site-specific DNA recombinase
MEARTGYTDGMTQREPEGGTLIRAVAHVRTSSEEQRRHGYYPDDQERELRGLRYWDLVKVACDEGLSGAAPARPGLRRIKKLAREVPCDVALATKRNRWFLDIEHRRRSGRGLRCHGARITALTDSGRAIADGVNDLISEKQRREIAQETCRGRSVRARMGEVFADVVPFAYHFTPHRKNFEVEKQEVYFVRKIFALTASGTGMNGVRSALQAEVVPPCEGSAERGGPATAPSKAGRRFWEPSGGVSYCSPRGRRMGTHTADRNYVR